MKSLWSDTQAQEVVDRYGARGVGQDLALRVYSARLLGAEPALVLHGGGNTSVKTRMPDVYGDMVDVLCVKGSGWDLATIEPQGHPAVRLEPLYRLRTLDALSDEAMVNALRSSLLDNTAPTPSVEALLHAYVKAKYIDHTHSLAAIAIADQPDGETVCRRLFGDRVVWVPYVMPGFALSKVVARASEAHPDAEGILLAKHGLFTFGETAKESYERMIDVVTCAERYIQACREKRGVAQGTAKKPPAGLADAARFMPQLRGLFARHSPDGAGDHWVFDLRSGDFAREFSRGLGLTDAAQRGVATPDHVIRMKGRPLVLPAPMAADLPGWIEQAGRRLDDFIAAYHAYFKRNNARVGDIKKELDPLPRVIVVPHHGVVGVGKTAGQAAINADIVESWMRVVHDAELCGRYEPVCEADEFDMEYWSLEQAKLGKQAAKPFQGHVVAVTGGGGGIGAATARAFSALGADVAVLDIDLDSAGVVARELGGFALPVACDVTSRESVGAAFDLVTRRYGGVDIVVSNAGIAVAGGMLDLPDDALRKSFDVNFYGHHWVARAAVDIMRRQGMGGVLLFNVSKQAVNPGRGFGAYGTSKAALLALVRQYALEHGHDGIRVNAVNADRIRSGLLNDDMIRARSRARGLSEADYMTGNLLGEEVTAGDVAHAFVMSAQLQRTTGNIMTVDGGNVAAMLR
jgi:rhamnose utilization protein RhaD (predicted bifunctional aldolase and dehydrogenase)/NAD(P)-dependent dehydrogenase (short-subunit alcohol dehydrogenase family)